MFSHCPLDVEKSENLIVVRLGRYRVLDEPTVEQINHELLGLADRPDCQRLVLDFSGVVQLSSAMLAKLVLLHRRMTPLGRKLGLCGMSPELRSVFATTMLDRLLDINDSEAGIMSKKTK